MMPSFSSHNLVPSCSVYWTISLRMSSSPNNKPLPPLSLQSVCQCHLQVHSLENIIPSWSTLLHTCLYLTIQQSPLLHRTHCQTLQPFQNQRKVCTFLTSVKPSFQVADAVLKLSVMDDLYLPKHFSPKYWRQATTNNMPRITIRMGLPANTHKTRRIIIKPFHYTFVQNIDPFRVEFVLHIIVPQFFHLYHFQKRISVLYFFIVVSQISKYIIETITTYILV